MVLRFHGAFVHQKLFILLFLVSIDFGNQKLLISTCSKDNQTYKNFDFQPPYERPRSQLATLWGATCHPRDAFERDVPFFDVTVGEWLLMDNMGAYSMVKVSGFNGSGFPPVHYRTDSSDVDRVSRILRAWRLSPVYCQAEEALGNSPTSAEKPGALL
ncbi:hypothetical protein HPB48_009562 [Haemaphysalis longicornis]|uniref:Orn/DAP/Arg decarboxylase 2 C-terminal domain-containing protein n=1 Tax=Haemaphysalis longicornis TaxID=44386 RepID=A0A9J6FYR8_HAELO|nr:hypothetical protein HPB48_009562 [Haemaphysalis longicornis]